MVWYRPATRKAITCQNATDRLLPKSNNRRRHSRVNRQNVTPGTSIEGATRECGSTATDECKRTRHENSFPTRIGNESFRFGLRRGSWTTLHRREHFSNHGDGGGADQNHEDARENEEHQREDQFHRGLCRLFLGDLPTPSTHRIALHAQCLGDAGTKLVGLNQNRRQRTQIIDAGSTAEVLQHLRATAPICKCRLQRPNSSAMTLCDFFISSATLRIAWSRPRPASTQTTIKSKQSGKPRKIASLRRLLRNHKIMSGTNTCRPRRRSWSSASSCCIRGGAACRHRGKRQSTS